MSFCAKHTTRPWGFAFTEANNKLINKQPVTKIILDGENMKKIKKGNENQQVDMSTPKTLTLSPCD